MSRVRTKFRLPLAGLVLALALLILAGCGGSASGQAGNGSASGHAGVTNNQGTPIATISGQAGQTTTPLPSDVPAPPNSSLQREYTATVNGVSATVWQYIVPSVSSASTPQNLASFYQQAMPTKGWSAAAVPTVTVSSPTGAPAAAQVYQKNGTLATIATGYVSGTSGPVMVIITVAAK